MCPPDRPNTYPRTNGPRTGPFARYLDARWKSDRPDIAHAHYWTSGIATQLAARHLGLPAVQTFHELGAVQKRHRGGTGLQHRLRLEAAAARGAAWVAATCTEEQFDLMRLGCARARVSVVRAASTRSGSGRMAPWRPRTPSAASSP